MIKDFFLKGGVLIYPLLLFSIIAVAIAAEKISTMKKIFVSKKFFTAILEFASQKNRKAVLEVIGNNKKKKNSSVELIEKIANSTYDIKNYNINFLIIETKSFSKIHILDLIGKISPMTGLAGTVIGLAKTFQSVSLSGRTGDAALLAGGIWEAMITTIAGLIIAIPVIIVSHMLKNSFENNLERLRQCCIAVMQIDDAECSESKCRENNGG
jgi:biopolymer transport protein ExbB